MPRSDFRFSVSKRVRFSEIDAQAVLFNSRYLEYFDLGMIEYWRAVGLIVDGGTFAPPHMHVVKALVDFKVPIVMDERIDICVRCSRIGTSSMTCLFELHGFGQEDLRATGEEVYVHVTHARGRSSPLPADLMALFERFEGHSLR